MKKIFFCFCIFASKDHIWCKMGNYYFRRLSLSIETLRFPLIFSIICLHCYTSISTVVCGHNSFFRIIYPIALWIGETGVPAYFFISGLLLYYSQKSFSQKLNSRVKTLLIPYLFFNGLILCGYLCMVSLGKQVFILDKDLADYSLVDYLRVFWDRGSWSHGNGSPLLCPLWYIRNLMILVFLSPAFYYIIKYTKLLLPLFIGIIWINSHDSAYSFQSLTMFSLGAYFPICDKSPMEIYDKNRLIFITVFFLLATLDFLHLFVTIPFALPIHRLSLIANVFFVLCFLGDYLHRHKLYSSFLSKSAFFVFCIHYPLTICLRPVFMRINGCYDIVLVITYIISVIGITLLCTVLYKILIRIIPQFMGIITGNRG